MKFESTIRKTELSPFARQVMAIVRKIPVGRVATYGQIAALAGKPHGSRGVGWILNACGKAHDLPWQRVINSKGAISFRKRTPEHDEQKKRLKKEGVRFSADGKIDLETYGWKKKPKGPARNQPKMFS